MDIHTPYRILLVEDDNYIARIIGLGMQMLGFPYTLDQATSAEEGLDLWDIQPYDIVLTDYNLRGKNGVKLIDELRRQPKVRAAQEPACAPPHSSSASRPRVTDSEWTLANKSALTTYASGKPHGRLAKFRRNALKT